MRDVFVADEGDLLKYGLLRALTRGYAEADSPLGVVWYYRRPLPTDRLTRLPARPIKPEHRRYDPELFDILYQLVASGRRTVAAVQRAGMLPEHTAYYARALPDPQPGVDIEASRREWHAAARRAVEQCAVAFLDPDNGIQPGSSGKSDYRRGRLPHALWSEISDHWRDGRTLVIFQHAPRVSDASGRGAQALADHLQTDRVHVVRRGHRWLYLAVQQCHAQTTSQALNAYFDRWEEFLSPNST